MQKPINVTKASGQHQLFSVEKLRNSLKRAGASDPVINKIEIDLTPVLYEGITTKKLYDKAHRLLRRLSKPEATRYQLKKAIMQLGPSGFPFEKFVARLLAETGYATSTSHIIQGKCVQHEIDVLGTGEGKVLIAECKYHNRGGIAVDVKIPLYVHARFQDILAANSLGKEPGEVTGYLITNARFTSDAIAYGTCAGLKLLSWDFPAGESLRDRIDATGLYPLTCLGTLTSHHKEALLAAGLVLVNDLLTETKKVQLILGVQTAQKAMDEAERLCRQTRLVNNEASSFSTASSIN